MTALQRKMRRNAALDSLAINRVGSQSLQTWWLGSVRGDELIYFCAKIGIPKRRVTEAAAACARLAMPYVEPGENRPGLALDEAEAFSRVEATEASALTRSVASRAASQRRVSQHDEVAEAAWAAVRMRRAYAAPAHAACAILIATATAKPSTLSTMAGLVRSAIAFPTVATAWSALP
ncbi:MAG: hypothetical protein GY944_24475 [bacterium]|nr:hypothetical protein [bacterium]